MKKSITTALLTIILLTTFSLIASAEDSQPKRDWVGGIGYLNLAEETVGKSIDLGAIVGLLGYKINISDNFYLIPEIRVGLGVGSDTLYDSYSDNYYKVESKFETEIDSLITFSVRGQFAFKSGVYLYVAPTYSRGSFSYSKTIMDQYINEDKPYISVYSDNDSLDDFAVRAGMGFNFNEVTSAELDYEKFKGSEVTTLGIRYNF